MSHTYNTKDFKKKDASIKHLWHIIAEAMPSKKIMQLI